MSTTKRVRKLTPQQRQKKAELETLHLEVQEMELSLAARKRKEARAMRLLTGTYDLSGTFSEESNDLHFARLYAWSMRNKEQPLNVFMHAWDDSMIATFGLHDMFIDLSRQHKLTICVQGTATLMPAVVLQAAHVRRMSKNSTIQLTPPEIENYESDPVASRKRDRFINRLYDELLSLLSRRSKLTPKQLKKRIGDHGWTLTAGKALEQEFIDEIV
jgi:hypothetical protein